MLNRDEYIKEKPRPKLNWKKIILITIGALFGAIVLALIGGWVFFVVNFKTYLNEADGVQISYPKTWTVKAHPADGVFAVFLSPKENSLDTFTENVNLSMYDMSQQPHSTEDYVKIMIDQVLMIFSDVKLVEQSLFPIAGEKGYRMVLKTSGDDPKTIVVYACTIGVTGFNLLYIGSSERYPKDRASLDAMALSLRVK